MSLLSKSLLLRRENGRYDLNALIRQCALEKLEESVTIARQLNDEACQANALDTLGDVAWRFGDFDKTRGYYAESLDLYRIISIFSTYSGGIPTARTV